jgi:hypothetical protein
VGAQHGVARWVGGGVGESKQHWRNDAPDPLRWGGAVRPPTRPNPPHFNRWPTDADANPAASAAAGSTQGRQCRAGDNHAGRKRGAVDSQRERQKQRQRGRGYGWHSPPRYLAVKTRFNCDSQYGLRDTRE